MRITVRRGKKTAEINVSPISPSLEVFAMPTIVSQIETAEKDLQSCESRLDAIDRKIRVSDLTDTQLKTLQNEEKELQKEKRKHETTLSRLRKENGKNTFLSFVILGLIVIVYYTFWGS